MLGESGRSFRVIIQFIASQKGVPAHYRLVAYRDNAALKPVDFYSSAELLHAFQEAAIPVRYKPGLSPDFPSQSGIVYAEELILDVSQLLKLGLKP